MNFLEYHNVQNFIEKVETYLSEDEASNNLPLGILYQQRNQDEANIYMALIERDGEILSMLVMTPPHNLIFIERTEGSIPFAVSSLLQNGINIPGVLGEKNAVFSFAKEWSHQSKQEYIIQMNQRIYRLDNVSSINLSNGKMRLATLSDLNLVQKWVMEFVKDTNEPAITGKHAENLALKKIEEQLVYLWVDQDDKPVSMACRARSTKNVVVVNLVYTPQEERKKGYASSLVWFLSQKLLQEFSYCALYTDLDNPTSNKIYQEIGYKPISDSVVIQFK